jgi:hypothetical protein
MSLIYQRRLPRREHIIAFRNKHLPDQRPPSDENMRRTGNAGAEPSSPMRHDSIKQASEPITAQKPTNQGGSLNAEGFMCALGLDLSSLRRQQQDNREGYVSMHWVRARLRIICAKVMRGSSSIALTGQVFALLKLLFVYDSPG